MRSKSCLFAILAASKAAAVAGRLAGGGVSVNRDEGAAGVGEGAEVSMEVGEDCRDSSSNSAEGSSGVNSAISSSLRFKNSLKSGSRKVELLEEASEGDESLYESLNEAWSKD
jgi:hypothetical protein